VKNEGPFRYYDGKGFLYSLDPLIKIAFMLALSLVSFAGGFWLCLAVTIILVIAALASRIKLWELLRGSKAILVMGLIVIAFRSLSFPPAFDQQGFLAGLIFAWRLYIAFVAASLFFAVTRIARVKEAASRINPAFGLALSLMLSFLPLFFEAWSERCLAWKARGGKPGPRMLAAVIPGALESLLSQALDKAAALEARGALL
jgi:energy-coupling factor transporter transmembrane protein EcfT